MAKNSEGGVGGGTLNRVFLEFGIKKSKILPRSQFQGGGGGESGRVFLKLWKENQGLPRALSQIQWGGVWWRKIRQSEVLEKKKLKSSRGHLQSNTMRGEVENQAECFLKFWKKRQGLFNSHLVEFGGRELENQAEFYF